MKLKLFSFRHWKSIWGRLFDSLLNTPSCHQQPSLRDFREEFEMLLLLLLFYHAVDLAIAPPPPQSLLSPPFLFGPNNKSSVIYFLSDNLVNAANEHFWETIFYPPDKQYLIASYIVVFVFHITFPSFVVFSLPEKMASTAMGAARAGGGGGRGSSVVCDPPWG